MTSSTYRSGEAFRSAVVALPWYWRVVTAALRTVARVMPLAMAVSLLTAEDPPNALVQIRMFAALVLAPEAAAWAISKAFAGAVRVSRGTVAIEQAGRVTEIEPGALASAEPWRIPLPGPGVTLRLASGATVPERLAMADPGAFLDALRAQRACAAPTGAMSAHALAYAAARNAAARGRLDHPLVKFVLFSLVPTLPAFRLHQYIAYGGTFGEYYTFGLKAYLLAFGIWWASWAIGLVLCAAVIRIVIEAVTVLVVFVSADRAAPARARLETLGRILFYVGIPGWLILRLMQ